MNQLTFNMAGFGIRTNNFLRRELNLDTLIAEELQPREEDNIKYGKITDELVRFLQIYVPLKVARVVKVCGLNYLSFELLKTTIN